MGLHHTDVRPVLLPVLFDAIHEPLTAHRMHPKLQKKPTTLITNCLRTFDIITSMYSVNCIMIKFPLATFSDQDHMIDSCFLIPNFINRLLFKYVFKYIMSVGEVYRFSTFTLGASQWGSRSCLLYTSPSPRDRQKSRMPSSA